MQDCKHSRLKYKGVWSCDIYNQDSRNGIYWQKIYERFKSIKEEFLCAGPNGECPYAPHDLQEQCPCYEQKEIIY